MISGPTTEPATVPEILTSGLIAQLLGVSTDRVQHVLKTRRYYIRPRAVAGKTRLYGEDALAQVRQALSGIDARRCDRRDDPADPQLRMPFDDDDC